MGYRLARRAEDQADQIFLEGADEWGVEAAARYNRLLLAVWTACAPTPTSAAPVRCPAFRV